MSGSRAYQKARKKNRRQRENQRKLDEEAQIQKEEAGLIRKARMRVERLRVVKGLRQLTGIE